MGHDQALADAERKIEVLKAALQEVRFHVQASSEAEHLMDSDDLLIKIDMALEIVS